jgi:hypothetical protein
MNKQRTIKAPCNDCGRETKHFVLKSHSTSVEDEEQGLSWHTRFDLLECCGCEFISLKRTFSFSEYERDQIEYFPPPISRREPNWGSHFLLRAPSEVQELLSEVYSALHANQRSLATMGARALLDMVIVDKVGDVGRFDQKLDALEKSNFVSKGQREILETALEAGNAATHRGHRPSLEALNVVMDIVENVLQQIYVLPFAAEELKKKIPERKKARQTAKTGESKEITTKSL